MPAWGVWVDGAFYFGTGRESQKARNLDARPELVVHLESGDEAVILEGVAEEVRDGAVRARVAAAYGPTYGWQATGEDLGRAFALRPRRAFARREADYPRSATVFRFPP